MSPVLRKRKLRHGGVELLAYAHLSPHGGIEPRQAGCRAWRLELASDWALPCEWGEPGPLQASEFPRVTQRKWLAA